MERRVDHGKGGRGAGQEDGGRCRVSRIEARWGGDVAEQSLYVMFRQLTKQTGLCRHKMSFLTLSATVQLGQNSAVHTPHKYMHMLLSPKLANAASNITPCRKALLCMRTCLLCS